MQIFKTNKEITEQYQDKPKRVIEHRFPDYKEIIITNTFHGGTSGGRKTEASQYISEHQVENKIINTKRVKKNLRRYALACRLYTHLVLTFAKEVENVDYADNEFKKFMKRLRYKTNIDFKYVATREIQEDRFKVTGKKVIHYHILLDRSIFGDLFEHNSDYVKLYGNSKGNIKAWQGINIVEDIWGHGWCKIVEHGNNLKAINYIIKYVSKSIEENLFMSENGQSKKAYLIAEGVKEMAENCKQTIIFTNFPNNSERNAHEQGQFEKMLEILLENTKPIYKWTSPPDEDITITAILVEREG